MIDGITRLSTMWDVVLMERCWAAIIGNGRKEKRNESNGEVGSFKGDLVIRTLALKKAR